MLHRSRLRANHFASKRGELRDLDPALTVMSVTSTVCFVTAARHSHALFLDERRADAGAWRRT